MTRPSFTHLLWLAFSPGVTHFALALASLPGHFLPACIDCGGWGIVYITGDAGNGDWQRICCNKLATAFSVKRMNHSGLELSALQQEF
jgi:hypothetical protein